jgi:hypothetical protein
MNKVATFVTLIAAAGLVTLLILMKDDMPDRFLAGGAGASKIGAEVPSFDEKTTKIMVAHQIFKEALVSVLNELKEGKISLGEATGRVHDAASRNWPGYVAHVIVVDGGRTPQESIARNLIAHVRSCVDVEPGVGARVKALEMELQDLLHQNAAATAELQAGKPIVSVDAEVGSLFAATGAPRAADKALAPEQAKLLPDDGKEVLVRFKVEDDFPTTTLQGTVLLCFNITPGDRRVQRILFNVVLSTNARDQFERIGVMDLTAHLRGRVVTVRGTVVHEILFNANINRRTLTIDCLDQFVSVR